MNKVTHAVVKFTQDRHITAVPIEKIPVFVKNKPKNRDCFKKHELYKVLWSDKRNPKEIGLPAQIGALTGKCIFIILRNDTSSLFHFFSLSVTLVFLTFFLENLYFPHFSFFFLFFPLIKSFFY